MDSHLSRRTVAGALKPPPESSRAGFAQKRCFPTVLLRIEFTATDASTPSGGLLPPPFHPYRTDVRRYISVALFLKSPSAGVTRYPCPVEPGLSSRTAFRLMPAAVWPARAVILTSADRRVKYHLERVWNVSEDNKQLKRDSPCYIIICNDFRKVKQ